MHVDVNIFELLCVNAEFFGFGFHQAECCLDTLLHNIPELTCVFYLTLAVWKFRGLNPADVPADFCVGQTVDNAHKIFALNDWVVVFLNPEIFLTFLLEMMTGFFVLSCSITALRHSFASLRSKSRTPASRV